MYLVEARGGSRLEALFSRNGRNEMKSPSIRQVLSFAATLALLAAATLFAADAGTGLQITPSNPAVINSGQSRITLPNLAPYVGTTPSTPPATTTPGQPSVTAPSGPVATPPTAPMLTLPGRVFSTPALPGAGPTNGTRINPSGILGGTASPNLNPGILPNVPSTVVPPATSTTVP